MNKFKTKLFFAFFVGILFCNFGLKGMKKPGRKNHSPKKFSKIKVYTEKGSNNNFNSHQHIHTERFIYIDNSKKVSGRGFLQDLLINLNNGLYSSIESIPSILASTILGFFIQKGLASYYSRPKKSDMEFKNLEESLAHLALSAKGSNNEAFYNFLKKYCTTMKKFRSLNDTQIALLTLHTEEFKKLGLEDVAHWHNDSVTRLIIGKPTEEYDHFLEKKMRKNVKTLEANIKNKEKTNPQIKKLLQLV